MANLHISIAAEPVFHVGGIPITNSIISTWMVMAFMFALVFILNRRLAKVSFTTRPSRLQNLFEYIVDAFLSLTSTTTAAFQKTRAFFPFIATFFLFIIFANWSGLIPGVGTIGFHEVTEGGKIFVPYFRAPTADINTTLALALFSVITTQVLAVKFLGPGYFGKFISFKSPINFAVGLLELISEISHVISFAFRLFGNIFAGEVLLSVMAFLMPVIAPIPFLGLEIFVGFIQALVFAMLTLVFTNTAAMAHEHE